MCFVITPHGIYLEVPQSDSKLAPNVLSVTVGDVHNFSSLNFLLHHGTNNKVSGTITHLTSMNHGTLLLYYPCTSGSLEGPIYIQDGLELETLSWAT